MSEQLLGKISQEDLEHFADLQRSEQDLYSTIGRYVVDVMNLSSQATQVRLQHQHLGEKIRSQFEIGPESRIRLAASGEVFLVED